LFSTPLLLGALTASGTRHMADVFQKNKTRIIRAATDDGQRLVGLAIDGVDEEQLVGTHG
jgi:hypothetical protein